MASAIEHVERLVRTQQDFPKPGILFRDLSDVLSDGEAFRAVVDDLLASVHRPVSDPSATRLDAIGGVEARGFLFAAAGAYALGCGALAIRKAGKLPGETLTEPYELEYGSAELELHPSRLATGARVLLVDDVLATGGTLEAAIRLLRRCGYQVAGVAVVIELQELGGRQRLGDVPIHSILRV